MLFVDFSNAVLKCKFRGVHVTVVDSVNPADIKDFLFQEKVLSATDNYKLELQKENPRQQCRDLMDILHRSDHPEAFSTLYSAMQQESALDWLVKQIDECTVQPERSPKLSRRSIEQPGILYQSVE